MSSKLLRSYSGPSFFFFFFSHKQQLLRGTHWRGGAGAAMGDQVLFDEGKRELFRASHNYKKLVRRLKATYNIQTTKEELTPERLRSVHCLVLAAPAEPLSPAEITALQAFIDGGGSLVVLSGEGGPGAVNSNVNDVVSKCVGAWRTPHPPHTCLTPPPLPP